MESSFSLLEQLENHIHAEEVLKLYPDSELPSIEHHRINENELELTYTSARGLSTFTYAIILGTADYFDEELKVVREIQQTAPVEITKLRLSRGK